MVYIKGHHPGTVWLKADIQCHSPRDCSWANGDGLPGGTDAHEQARQAWAEEFVAECQRRSLRLVAITDHHDAVMSSYVFAAGLEVEGFHPYRGIEVTCQDNVQCLALFDPACDDDIIGKFLGLLVGILPARQTDALASRTKAARMTLSELFEKVRAEPVLERQCVLLPHFSEADAHKNANQEGFSQRFAQLECDGVYIERPFSELSPATIQKIRGDVPEWGKMRRAVFATGDNKRPNWERLGVHNCWVKVGEHSVEALRQAMLADEARITFEEPKVPAETITSLTIFSSLTGGEPLTMSFNAGFNAIIGGRGSGKSSVIEYIRFGLARTASDLQYDDGVKAKERDEKLIEETLVEGGYVEIVLERDGVQETWRRDLATRDHVTVTDQRGLSVPLLLDDARRRFRARAFEQKGLSSTMMDKSTAADQITGIAAAEELEQRRHVDEKIQASKRSVATELRMTASFWQLQLDHQRTQSRLEDVKARLDANAKKLSEEGMSQDALAVLERAPLFARARLHRGCRHQVRHLQQED